MSGYEYFLELHIGLLDFQIDLMLWNTSNQLLISCRYYLAPKIDEEEPMAASED